MTSQEKIHRLASSALESSVPSGAPSRQQATLAVALRQSPWRMDPPRAAGPPPRPFVPYVPGPRPELRTLFKDRRPRGNRRRPLRKPPLGMAVCSLLTSLCAFHVTSPAGEARLTAAVPGIVLGIDRVADTLRDPFGDTRGLAKVSLDEARSR
jgi:hypothetical protein